MRRVVLIVSVFCLLIFGGRVESQEKDYGAIKEWSLFTAGILSGFAAHELGHQIAASASGVHLTWSIKELQLSWLAKSEDGIRLRNIALGGTAAEILSSEILLYSPAPKDSSFVIGWLLWNIMNPLLYVSVHEIKGGHGDLKVIQQHENGLNVRWVEAVKVAHALWTSYRLWKNDDFQKSKIRLYFASTSDGVMASLQYQW